MRLRLFLKAVICVCMHSCIHICTYVCICIHVCVYTCIYVMYVIHHRLDRHILSFSCYLQCTLLISYQLMLPGHYYFVNQLHESLRQTNYTSLWFQILRLKYDEFRLHTLKDRILSYIQCSRVANSLSHSEILSHTRKYTLRQKGTIDLVFWTVEEGRNKQSRRESCQRICVPNSEVIRLVWWV